MEYILFSLMFMLILFNLVGLLKQIPQLVEDIELRWYNSIKYDVSIILCYLFSTVLAVCVINNL